MKMKIKNNSLISIVLSTFFIFCSCNTETNSKETHIHEDEMHEHEDMIFLSQEQCEAIQLKLDTLPIRDMGEKIKAYGTLAVAPQDKSEVTSMQEGNVVKILAFEGEKVKKGHILAYIQHPDFIQLQQEYLNSSHRLTFLHKEYERQQILYKNQVGAGKDFQKTEKEYNIEKTNHQALQLRLEMLGLNLNKINKGEILKTLPIYAPINGYINSISVALGSYVNTQTKLFSISNNDAIHADINVFEKKAGLLKKGQKIRLKIAGREKETTATIFAIAKEYNKSDKSITVHAKLDKKIKDLVLGNYISAEITTKSEKRFAVPNTAIVENDGKKYLFIEVKDTHEHSKNLRAFKMIEIIPDVSNDDWTAISLLNPIEKGTLIVLKNAYYLLADIQKKEATHQH